MKRKYPEGKGRKKITVTIDKNLNEVFDEYIKDNGYYNKSQLVEDLIKKKIEEDKKSN
jgi:metal-responsive CopG/Arc/MetJ family transcriptional regulator